MENFEVSEHNAALGRTGHGTFKLDLKRAEQSLESLQSAAAQLSPGDDFR
jgi:hypothetical protein